MPDGMDWLLRPVSRGLCHYADLKSGILDLHDLAVMNDLIDVEARNTEILSRKD